MSSWCTLLAPLPKHLVPILRGRRREVPINLCSWIRPKQNVYQGELMKVKPRSGCCWQKEQFHRDSVQCKWAIRALVLRMNLRAAAFQLGFSTIAKPSKHGGVETVSFNTSQWSNPHSLIHDSLSGVNADLAMNFLSVNDYCGLGERCRWRSKRWTGMSRRDIWWNCLRSSTHHTPVTPNFSVWFHLWNCWGLCWERDARPPLFTLLQPEMLTDGVWIG